MRIWLGILAAFLLLTASGTPVAQTAPLEKVTINQAAAAQDPEGQQAAFEKITGMTRDRALLRILYYRIHDIYAYRKALNFIPRHDEALYPWEISAK